MSKVEGEQNNESKHDNNINNKEEIITISSNDNSDKKNIKLENELLASLFKNEPQFEIKYENEELNKFKDDILKYLADRNQHYMSLIKNFQDKILENKKEYHDQINSISQNYNYILSSQASINNKIDKISNFELFINKTNDQLITHEIRINNLSSDFIKSTQKYDKIYLDNLELPGYIGKFAKFKNCQVFFDHIIRELDKVNQYKERNNMDIKAYKEKLDGIIKSIHLIVKNNNEAQLKYIKQLNDKSFRECKDMNDILSNRVCDLRIENAKYSIDLIKKNDEMNKEWKKILEIKDNLLNLVYEKINNFKNIFNNNVTSFNNFKKEFEEFKIQLNEIINYYRESKSDNINSNMNNNSCNNYTGCYISSALPLEKKNWKYFPRRFSRKAKSKTKYFNDKKQLIKNTLIMSQNKNNDNNNSNLKNEDIITLDNDNIKIEDNIEANNKEKENKKRYVSSSLNKDKTIISTEKKKNSSENHNRKNVYGFKEPRSCKSVSKIEINSHDKINSIELCKRDENRNKLNEEKIFNKINLVNTNKKDIQKIIINNESINSNNIKTLSIKNQEKEKEKIFIHGFRKSKRPVLVSNKSIHSEDLENNNKSNINNGNCNTLNTTNDNFSIYSTNSISIGNNVNKFILNEGLLDANDHVIKELASELEQSTNKKDKLASNKKKIEDNFKLICNKIAPINLKDNLSINENDNEIDQDLNENANNNLNVGENAKVNTISTEKTDEPKTANNNNNVCTININQNDYNSLNKKIDLFDKKLIDLETLLKEKIIEILLQMDNLQNICYYSLNKKKIMNQKLNKGNNMYNSNSNFENSINVNANTNTHLIMNRSSSNDYLNTINNNIITHNSHDDYFINCHSIKKIAPIIEIDPNNLQFSPSPTKTQTIIGNKINKENKNKKLKVGFTNNFKEIKIFNKRGDNKENMRTINNMDHWDLTQYRLFGKTGNFQGVNKWINLNKLIKYEQSKTANTSNNGGLLANGNFDCI